MGKGSGIDSVKHWLQRASIEATEEQAMEVLGAVKAWGLQYKRLMNQEEFNALANGVLSA